MNGVSVSAVSVNASGLTVAESDTPGTGAADYTGVSAAVGGQGSYSVYGVDDYNNARVALIAHLDNEWSEQNSKFGVLVGAAKGSLAELLAATTSGKRYDALLGYEANGASAPHQIVGAAVQRIRASIGENPVKSLVGKTLNGIEMPSPSKPVQLSATCRTLLVGAHLSSPIRGGDGATWRELSPPCPSQWTQAVHYRDLYGGAGEY